MIAAIANIPPAAAVAWVVVIASCCVAVSIDVRVRRIPNVLTLPLWAAGLAWWAATQGFGGLGQALGGMAVAGLPFFLLWIICGTGAGDAKMMFAIGAWLGVEHAAVAVVAVALAGGLLSLGYAVAHGRLRAALVNTAWVTFTLPMVVLGPGRLADRQKLVPRSSGGDVGGKPLKTPYSLAMLAGTCAAATWVWSCAS